MELLNAEAILSADDRQWADVDVPEWGGSVRVLGLSGTDRDAYEKSLVNLNSEGRVTGYRLEDTRARLVAKCLVNEQFERLFSEKQVKALGAKNGMVIDRLYEHAQRLSGMGEQARRDAVKNSEAGQAGDSTSD